MNDQQYDLVIEALRVLFIVGFPFIGVMAVAGVAAAAVQTTTALHDTALAYAPRLAALLLACYLLLPYAAQALVDLSMQALS